MIFSVISSEEILDEGAGADRARFVLFGLIETYHGLITNDFLLQSVNVYFFTDVYDAQRLIFFGVLFVALGMALAGSEPGRCHPPSVCESRRGLRAAGG